MEHNYINLITNDANPITKSGNWVKRRYLEQSVTHIWSHRHIDWDVSWMHVSTVSLRPLWWLGVLLLITLSWICPALELDWFNNTVPNSVWAGTKATFHSESDLTRFEPSSCSLSGFFSLSCSVPQQQLRSHFGALMHSTAGGAKPGVGVEERRRRREKKRGRARSPAHRAVEARASEHVGWQASRQMAKQGLQEEQRHHFTRVAPPRIQRRPKITFVSVPSLKRLCNAFQENTV